MGRLFYTEWFLVSVVEIPASESNAFTCIGEIWGSVIGCVASASVDSSLCTWSVMAEAGIITPCLIHTYSLALYIPNTPSLWIELG